MASPQPADARRHAPIGTTVQRLRRRAGLTLTALAAASGVSASALSKIENDNMSPTYDTMVRLARGLRVDLPELFGVDPAGALTSRRVITRAGDGIRQSTPHYDYEMLCSDIARKAFTPLVTTLRARSIEEFHALADRQGLVAALDAGRLAFATLDVTSPEPLPDDHPLLTHPRVLATPHIAWSNGEDPEIALGERVLAGLDALMAGGEPGHQVDPARGY